MLLSNSSQNSRHRIHRHHRRHRHRRHLRFATGETFTLLWGISPSPYSSRCTYDSCHNYLYLDQNSEQAIYWITGINLSTFSFSRSDDPDASGLVFVWPLISKSWIDRIARKIITSQHLGGSRQHRGQRPPWVQHWWERLRGKVDVSYRATEFWC